MTNTQAGILQLIPNQARYLTFTLTPEIDPAPALQALAGVVDGDKLVVGLGMSLVRALGKDIEGLKPFPQHVGPGFDVPSTPMALWCWLRGDDRGDLVHQTRVLREILEPVFVLDDVIDAFRYREFRDLSGYEDGTENPKDDDAIRAAIRTDGTPGLDGSSLVAVQQWVHDLDLFYDRSPQEQDDIVGRHRVDNEEFDEAPESAHVKRTAQESFEPEAFVVRRSMPWADAGREGLVFVCFGATLNAFEAQLNRMVGNEDGITDGLFLFTRPVTGSYFWCPPMKEGGLDLTALALD